MKHSGLHSLKYVVLIMLFAVLLGKILKILLSDDVFAFIAIYGISITSVLALTFFISYRFYKDPYEIACRIPGIMDHKPLISCMVAVFNEEKIIDQCIISLLNQTYENKEIIFVNDCSRDRTREILDEYARHYPIRVIHLEKNVGKKRALGQAMLQARGELFAFSDSDSIWAPDAVEKIAYIFNADPDVGAVSGHCRALNANASLITRIQDTWYEGQFSIRKAFESVFGAVTCVSGPLAVFRRSAIFNYIPAWENDAFLGQEFKFATDRTLTGFVLGSRSIGFKLKKRYADSIFVTSEDYQPHDWKVVYCKAARSWTQVPDTFRRVLKQQIRWKKSFIRNTFFTGAFYWRKPLLPALFYYLHIVYVLIGPIVSFRHLVLLPAEGKPMSGVLYLAGIIFVGLMFGLAYKQENENDHHWIYRPLMSLMSTLILSWVIFYSALTIKKMVWLRG